jgi:hypothetical protein
MNPFHGPKTELGATMQKIRLPWRQLPLLSLPRFLSGFRLGDWWRLLRKHRFSIDPIFWPRAVAATLGATATSILARFEEKVSPESVDTELLEKPVFILGLPRSGTTHLFELLSQSPDLCFPTRFDAFNPHTFLFLRHIGLFALLSKLPKFKRAMDNVRVGWDSPEEDSVGLAVLSLKGEKLDRIFPRDAALQDKSAHHVGFSGIQEAADLVAALRVFTRKLVWLHRKRVLLKSPRHMTRVEAILEAFPHARFVTIFRNPLHQFASLTRMRDTGNPFWAALQWPLPTPKERDFHFSETMLQNYFLARGKIPASNLVEITFEDLVADRPRVIARIFERLGLRGPENLENQANWNRAARVPAEVPDEWIPSMLQHYAPLYANGIYSWPGKIIETAEDEPRHTRHFP